MDWTRYTHHMGHIKLKPANLFGPFCLKHRVSAEVRICICIHLLKKTVYICNHGILIRNDILKEFAQIKSNPREVGGILCFVSHIDKCRHYMDKIKTLIHFDECWNFQKRLP